jgi:hypothetical protein
VVAAVAYPTNPVDKVWRGPVAPMIPSWLVTILIGVVALFFLLIPFIAGDAQSLRIFILFAVLAGLLTIYLARDALGKRPWRIEVGAQGLTLGLPAGRSLIHNPAACRRTIAVADVAAVQARDEVYKGLVSAQMHRAHRLLLKDGSDIPLFEERALGTRIATASLNPIAADLATQLGAPFNDLGMAQGVNGLLGAVFRPRS